jgi:hypothetical protein
MPSATPSETATIGKSWWARRSSRVSVLRVSPRKLRSSRCEQLLAGCTERSGGTIAPACVDGGSQLKGAPWALKRRSIQTERRKPPSAGLEWAEDGSPLKQRAGDWSKSPASAGAIGIEGESLEPLVGKLTPRLPRASAPTVLSPTSGVVPWPSTTRRARPPARGRAPDPRSPHAKVHRTEAAARRR